MREGQAVLHWQAEGSFVGGCRAALAGYKRSWAREQCNEWSVHCGR